MADTNQQFLCSMLLTSGFVAVNISTILFKLYFPLQMFCRGDEVDEDESKKVLKMLQTSVSLKHVSYLYYLVCTHNVLLLFSIA